MAPMTLTREGEALPEKRSEMVLVRVQISLDDLLGTLNEGERGRLLFMLLAQVANNKRSGSKEVEVLKEAVKVVRKAGYDRWDWYNCGLSPQDAFLLGWEVP